MERNGLAADGQDLVHAVISDHLSHGGLRHIPEGGGDVPHVEQECIGVIDLELHDPLHDPHVEIAGQHERLLQKLAPLPVLRSDVRLNGPEAKLLFQLALHRHLVELLDERQFEV